MTIISTLRTSALLPVVLLACASTVASAATADVQDAQTQAAAAVRAEGHDRAVVIAPRGGKTNLRITPVSLVVLGIDTRR